jgi:hypothetical protein
VPQFTQATTQFRAINRIAKRAGALIPGPKVALAQKVVSFAREQNID